MTYSVSFDAAPKLNSYPGLYLALEGIDGSGKTTQLATIKDYFQQAGKEVVTVRFPRRDSGIFASINAQVIQGESTLPKPAFQYLFSADYLMLQHDVINPALAAGKVVITDRFHCWSSFAYGMSDVESDNNAAKQSLLVANGLLSPHQQFYVPNLTFYFSISVTTAMQRMEGKVKKDIYEKKEVLEKVTRGYDWLLSEFPDFFVTIDAEQSIDEVTIDIVKRLP